MAAVADGGLAMMPEADQVALGGVRSHPERTGRWTETGIALTDEGTVSGERRLVPRSETLRAALLALGYEE